MDLSIVNESFNHLPAFGLDFSDRSIKVVQFCRQSGELKLRSYNKKDIPEGIVVGGEVKNVKALVKEIKRAVDEARPNPITTKEIVVSLPESKCFIKVIRMPTKMSHEEIGETIRFKAEEYFPLAADEMCLDWHVLDTEECPIDSKGMCTEVLVAVASRLFVESYLEVTDAAGLVPVVFEAESVATARALLKNHRESQSVLIVDLGRDRTSFIFYKHPTLRFTQSIPISGENFTLSVAKGFKVNFEKAEKLKNENGLSRDSRDGEKVFEMLSPQLEQLVSNIKRSIDYYNEYFGISAKSNIKIVICGGGANLRSIDSYLSLKLNLPVELADPWKGIYGKEIYVKQPKIIKSISYAESLYYTTALGLALYNVQSSSSS